MPRLDYSSRAFDDAERLVEFLRESDPRAAEATWGLIESAVNALRDHPYLGRPVEEGIRELVISRGRSGYLALYSFDGMTDRVVVLAIRHQREAGYR
ncbi:MAG: type II toxin-antitoxin system RelE/ParE family toxin [Myxococcales bacterium]